MSTPATRIRAGAALAAAGVLFLAYPSAGRPRVAVTPLVDGSAADVSGMARHPVARS